MPQDLADSHPEDVEVPKDATPGTHELGAVSMTISGDPNGLKEGIYSAKQMGQRGL